MTSAERATELIRQGDALEDDPAKALELYEQAIETEPTNGEAIASAAATLDTLGRRGEGLERVRQAIQRDALDALGLAWLGNALAVLGAPAEARPLLERAEALPDGGTAGTELLVLLAQGWSLVEDPAQAVRLLAPVLAAAPAGSVDDVRRVARILSNSYIELDQWADALEVWDRVLADDPEDSEALVQSAALLLQMDRLSDAVDRVRHALATGRLDTDARRLAAAILRPLAPSPEVAAALNDLSASADTPDAALDHVLATAWINQGDPQRALPLLDAALTDESFAASSDAAEALKQRARASVQTGDFARAAADLDALRTRDVPFEELWLRLLAGIAYNNVGRAADALEVLKGLPETIDAGSRAPTLFQLGIATAVVEGRPSGVPLLREAYAAAEDKNLKAAVALQLALGLPAANAERAQLLDEADEALPPEPDFQRAMIGFARAEDAIAENRWDDALTLLGGLAERLPAQVAPIATLDEGLALMRAGRIPEADAVLDQAIKDELAPPTKAAALTVRAKVRALRWRWAEARADLAEALDFTDDPARRQPLRISMATCDMQLGRLPEALRELDDLAREQPENSSSPEYWGTRANVLLLTGDAAGAVEAVRRQAQLDPRCERQARFVEFAATMVGGGWGAAWAMLPDLAAEPSAEAVDADWLVAAIARGFLDRADTADALERYLRRDPTRADLPPVRQVRMLLAVRAHDLAAFDAAKPPEESRPDQVLAHSLRAEVLLESGRDTEALEEFALVVRAADEQSSKPLKAYGALAQIRRAQVLLLGDKPASTINEALDDAERRLAGTSGDAPYRVLLGLVRAEVLAQAGQIDAALSKLSESEAGEEDLTPGLRPAVQYVKGQLLRLNNDDETALVALRRAVEAGGDLDVVLSLVEVQASLGDDEDALKNIDRALTGEPTVEEARLRRIRSILLSRMGRLEEALAEARRALEVDRGAQSWSVVALQYEALGRLGPAETAFRRAWLQSRNDEQTAAWALVGLTRVQLGADRSRDALEALDVDAGGERMRRLDQTYGSVPYNRAVALLRCGHEQRAAQELRKAARAKWPVAGANDLAARLEDTRSHGDSYLGYWFAAAGKRRVAGSVLLVLLGLTAALAVFDPRAVGWLGWASSDTVGRLAPLLVVAGLLLLPTVTKLKLGTVEIEQPAPAAPSPANLLPASQPELILTIAAAVNRTVRQVAQTTVGTAASATSPPMTATDTVTQIGDTASTQVAYVATTVAKSSVTLAQTPAGG